MFLTGNLAVLHSSGNVVMSQMFLQQPQAVSGIIELNGMHREGISQPVRTDIVFFAAFGVHQFGETSFDSTVPDYFPGSMPVKTK